MGVEVNYGAVFLAALSSMLVGGIWYSMKVFGKPWAKLARVDMTKKVERNEMVALLAAVLFLAFITAYVLAHLAYISHSFFQNSFLRDALMTGLWVWFGFTAVRIATHDLFEGRRKKLTVLNLGNEFFTIMLMALVIGEMGH